jgi:hypothetical protein
MVGEHTDLGRTEIPVACTLTAEALVASGNEIAELFRLREEVRELPDGYAVRFPGDEDLASRLLAFVMAERACCPFFTFEITFEPGRGPIWLGLRGPEGAKDIVATMFAWTGLLLRGQRLKRLLHCQPLVSRIRPIMQVREQMTVALLNLIARRTDREAKGAEGMKLACISAHPCLAHALKLLVGPYARSPSLICTFGHRLISAGTLGLTPEGNIPAGVSHRTIQEPRDQSLWDARPLSRASPVASGSWP